MKKLGIVILIMSFFTVGCGELYTIEPEIVNTSENASNNNEQEVSNSETETNEVKEEDNGPTEEELAKAEEERLAEEEEAARLAQEESDRLAEEEREALIDELFVSQFSNDTAYDLDVDVSELDNTETSWSFKRNTEHEAVTGYYDVDITLFDTYFVKDTDEKVMYLTFDEGYEQGYTGEILDILKDNNVKATFFITSHYLNSQPDLVKRMVDEGHLVANHTVNHPSMPTLTEEEIYEEINVLAEDFKEVTGTEMAPFFRPPSGKYSERTLYLTRKLGYRTIFWSMAFGDWDPDNQPGSDVSYNHVLDNYHDGAIILLHAVSESNTQALDAILKDIKALGYRFGSLYELD